MASESNEIGDIVKKCKILLLDIEGTTTSISFVKEKLFPYAEANVKEFLENQWDTEDVKEAVAALRKLAIEDEEQKVEGVVAIPGEDAGKEEQIEGLVKSIKWQMAADRKAGPLKQLQGLIWKQGYDKGDIKGHVYDDVAPALALWNSTEDQKVYIYSSGSVQAQKLLFGQSAAGDLLTHIEGHFDTAIGAKQEAASYTAIVEKIGCKPEEILFLTDIVKEAEAARSSGLQAALVTREGNAPLPTDATTSYPVVQSFDQLTVSNKRKPEPQEQEVPAKIPKTDVEANVKTATEMEVPQAAPETVETVSETVAPTEEVSVSDNTTAETVNAAEPEKMEVEEEIYITEQPTVTEQAEETEDTAVQIKTVVEEVTAANEASEAPICDAKPVIEEIVEKTDKNETEKMETESADNVETVETVVEPEEQAQEKIDEQKASVTAETPPGVTIQEVTNDQEIASEGIEVVDDLVPVVEEPPAVEMEDLNNVADVLDKECDEILLKVHDVTNLDNIPVKPLLNSIAEEDIENENGENTNDIVDSILDSEMELGVKTCEDIDIDTVQEIADTKADPEVIIPDKVENNDTGINKAKEITAETPVDDKTVTESTVEDKAEIIKEAYVSETVTNKDEEVIPPSLTEITNVGTEECAIEVLPEAESVTEIDNNDSIKPTEKSSEFTTDSITSTVVPEDTKMESEESTVPPTVETQSEVQELKMEIADSAPKPVETNESEQKTVVSVENELEIIKDPIEEKIDNKIESEDTAEAVKNETEMKENNLSEIANENKSEESNVKAEDKMESEESNVKAEENKMESEESNVKVEDNKMEESNVDAERNKMKESNVKAEENKMESEESGPQERQAKEIEPEAVTPESKTNIDENESQAPIVPEPETESKEIASNDAEMETEATEKVNGNMNGESEVNQNGDASKEKELSARLSVENGDNGKGINGANGNGDSSEVEKGQGENKEIEIPDIKVKTVSTDEPRTDPIEQPVEA